MSQAGSTIADTQVPADRLSRQMSVVSLTALLVGLAAKRKNATIKSLKGLNELRTQLAGGAMDLPVSGKERAGRSGRSRRKKTRS